MKAAAIISFCLQLAKIMRAINISNVRHRNGHRQRRAPRASYRGPIAVGISAISKNMPTYLKNP